jgi:hypothetical protein
MEIHNKKMTICPKTSLMKLGKEYAKDYVYRFYNDTIPSGYMVCFKDGVLSHLHKDNLELRKIEVIEKQEPTEAMKEKMQKMRGNKAKQIMIDNVIFKSQYSAAKFLNISTGNLHHILENKKVNETGKAISYVVA